MSKEEKNRDDDSGVKRRAGERFLKE